LSPDREEEKEGDCRRAYRYRYRVDHRGWMHAHTRRRAEDSARLVVHVTASRNSEEPRNSGTSWNPTWQIPSRKTGMRTSHTALAHFVTQHPI